MQSRSFTKLFASITDSSIWSEPDHIVKVWITMLAMSDEHGIVDGTVPGLAARSRKTIAEVEEALAKFMAPDPHSRTRDFEGRRVAECPGGGWVLLNHEKYRAVIRAESLKQAKREWAQRARDSARALSADVGSPSPRVEKRRTTLSVSVSGSDLDPEGGAGGNPSGVFDAPTIAVDPKRGRVAPEDFEPNEIHRVRCAELRLDVNALLREFKAFEFNREYSDWPRRFARWIEDHRKRVEADRAKAASGAAKGPRSGFQGRGVLPALEPSDAHRRFALKHSLDVDAIVADLERKNIPETLGIGRARELIGAELTKAARARARAAGATP